MAAVIFPSPPPRAKEAVEFYEVVFGAQTIQHSSRPVAVGVSGNKSLIWLSSYCIFVGSNRITVSDRLEDLHVAAVASVPHICPSLVTTDIYDMVAKSVANGCVLMESVSEDPYRPVVLVGTLRDPFGVTWSFCNSAIGFLSSSQSLSVLLVSSLKPMKNSAHRAAKLLLLDNATPAVKFHYVTAAGAARKYETTGPLDSVVVFSDSMDSLTPDFIHTMEEKGSRLIIMCNKGVVRDAASRMVVYKEPTDDHDLLVALSRIADGLARERRRRF